MITSNFLILLVSKLFDLTLSAFILRVLLQWVRADFYSPLSQLVYRVTNPAVQPIARFLPKLGRFDIAGGLLLLLLTCLNVICMFALYGQSFDWLYQAKMVLLKIFWLTLLIYSLSLFAQALLSWLGPGLSNPAANVLWSLNEPLLRPIRRFLPLVGGIDLSPLLLMVVIQALAQSLPLSGYVT